MDNKKIFSVSLLNQSVARLLEMHIPLCWVAGEVSNMVRAASGHWYFTLKDEQAQVRAVMFKGRAQYASFTPREGDKVEVRAQVSLYAPRGDYQLNVEAIRRAGVGDLYEQFLRLKAQLEHEGLFAPERKLALPLFARTIGILTSLQAAALQDVLSAFARRAPHVRLIIYPIPVQGAGAGEKIAQMIATANARAECDLLLLVRGGGSIEDLWSFNEEVVARAIAARRLPMIAGIGHETDFTIADFVADLRAPTPTAAAELAARSRTEWLQVLQGAARRLQTLQHRHWREQAQRLDLLTRRLEGPQQRLARLRLELQSLQQRMQAAWSRRAQAARHRLQQQQTRLTYCLPSSRAGQQYLQQLQQRMVRAQNLRQQHAAQQLAMLKAQLDMLNPARTLARGYAIAQDEAGALVRDAASLGPGAGLILHTAQSSARFELASSKPHPPLGQDGGKKRASRKRAGATPE
ncbi:exodeoxyribonuclease VII large subunit [Massilia sp. W12]|uniref:exodeoxyribonuclease VII large subunit n=1 Tax=Massilia sp. W12 TaxID=3126507 RepID=UPI0030CC5412